MGGYPERQPVPDWLRLDLLLHTECRCDLPGESDRHGRRRWTRDGDLTLVVAPSIFVLDPTAGGALSLSGQREHQHPGRRLRRFQLVERPVGQRQRHRESLRHRCARRRPEERQRQLQSRAGHGGGDRRRPARLAGAPSASGLTNSAPRASAGTRPRRSIRASTARSPFRATPA